MYSYLADYFLCIYSIKLNISWALETLCRWTIQRKCYLWNLDKIETRWRLQMSCFVQNPQIQQIFSRLRLEPEKLLFSHYWLINHSSKILADHFLLVYWSINPQIVTYFMYDFLSTPIEHKPVLFNSHLPPFFFSSEHSAPPIKLSHAAIHSQLMKCLLNQFKPLIPINST